MTGTVSLFFVHFLGTKHAHTSYFTQYYCSCSQMTFSPFDWAKFQARWVFSVGVWQAPPRAGKHSKSWTLAAVAKHYPIPSTTVAAWEYSYQIWPPSSLHYSYVGVASTIGGIQVELPRSSIPCWIAVMRPERNGRSYALVLQKDGRSSMTMNDRSIGHWLELDGVASASMAPCGDMMRWLQHRFTRATSGHGSHLHIDRHYCCHCQCHGRERRGGNSDGTWNLCLNPLTPLEVAGPRPTHRQQIVSSLVITRVRFRHSKSHRPVRKHPWKAKAGEMSSDFRVKLVHALTRGLVQLKSWEAPEIL
jgi:hypothetical protein